MDRSGYVDPGFAMDSAWRGAAAARDRLLHLDDVPARAWCSIWPSAASRWRRSTRARTGRRRHCWTRRCSRSARRHQRRHPNALRIRFDRNGFPAAVRTLQSRLDPGTVAADEIVRVRALPAWLRIDARFGSVYRRRGDPALGAALGVPSRACGLQATCHVRSGQACLAVARHARSRKN